MIALFDSGFGGLTVLKPLMKELPEYDYIYLGDNARAPYGGHSEENIKLFAEQAVDYLFARGARLILFACNTASSVALRHVQQKYLQGKDEKERKILGVLIPLTEKVAENKDKVVGVVGTRATINSHAYEAEIHKLNKNIKVHSVACPLLVPFIEEGWHKKPEAVSILKKYLRPLKSCNLNSLILGCTHYPLMHSDFKRIMGKKVKVLDSGEITAKSLQDYLTRHPEIESKLGKNGKRTFLTTDSPEKMEAFARQYLNLSIPRPQKVEL